MRIFILGHGQHGKDEVAKILCRKQPRLSFKSSSEVAAETVVRPYLAERGIVYTTLHECYEDRSNHRKHWYDAITAFNQPDRTKLPMMIFAESDIYVGLRNREEFLAMKNFVDLTIWVDAGRRVAPEDESSNTVFRSDADVIIDNSTTIPDLEARVLKFWATTNFRFH